MKSFIEILKEGSDHFIELVNARDHDKLVDKLGDDADEIGYQNDVMIVPNSIWKNFTKITKKNKIKYRNLT